MIETEGQLPNPIEEYFFKINSLATTGQPLDPNLSLAGAIIEHGGRIPSEELANIKNVALQGALNLYRNNAPARPLEVQSEVWRWVGLASMVEDLIKLKEDTNNSIK
jgi:hypothetical protein